MACAAVGQPRASVAATKALGRKRGRVYASSTPFSVPWRNTTLRSSGSLRAASSAPPKLRDAHPAPPEVDETVAAALASTDYSSQDQIPDTAQPHTEKTPRSSLATLPAGQRSNCRLRVRWR